MTEGCTELPARVRLVVADDHESMRHTLVLLFEQVDFVHVVAVAENGLEAVAACDAYHPDVVLLDILMPEMDGIDATRIIRQKHPSIRVIGMTGMQHSHLERDVLQAGAIGLLFKGAPVDRMLDAISLAVQTN